MEENRKSLFDTLSAINVSEHTEKKGELTYLTWAWAWAEFRKVCPMATYEVHKDQNGNMFSKTEEGYMVWTTVSPGEPWSEKPLDMWLPVMDHKMNANKQADVTSINKAIMRCLTKNISMFGLGLYIYAGEDLPETSQIKDENLKKAQSLGIDMKRLAIYNKVDENQITDGMILDAIAKKEAMKAKKTAEGLPTEETIVLARTIGYRIEDVAKELGKDILNLTDEEVRQFIKDRTK